VRGLASGAATVGALDVHGTAARRPRSMRWPISLADSIWSSSRQS